MPARLLKAVVLSGLLLCTQAFKLTFFKDGSTCGGAPLGTFIGGEGQGCRRDFVGSAGGVLIENTGPVDDHTRVVFYRTSDCDPNHEIAEGDIACLGIANEGLPNYLSFNVVPEPPAVGGVKPRALTQNQKRANSTPDTVRFIHGGVHVADGKRYRMQQVYSTGFFAIPYDEWDDAVHTQNDEDLPPIDESLLRHLELASSGSQTDTYLEERAFNLASCKVALHCAKRNVQNAISAGVATGTTLVELAPAWIANAATAARVRGQSFVQYMDEHNFYCALSTGVDFGLATWVAGRFGGPPTPNSVAQCSSNNNEVDALTSAIARLEQAELRAMSALTITITQTVTEVVSFLTLSTIDCDQGPIGDQCSLPTGFCQPEVGATGTNEPSFDKI